MSMENKKLTAVEWLKEKFIENGLIDFNDDNCYESVRIINQAIELEKEQIIEAHDSKFKVIDEKFENGGLTAQYQSGLGYYNEKYGSKESN